MSVAKSSESSDSRLIVSEIKSDCDTEEESEKSGGTEGGSHSETVKILKEKKRSPVWDFFVAVDSTGELNLINTKNCSVIVIITFIQLASSLQ